MTISNLYISDGGLRLARLDDTLTLGEAGRGRRLCTLQLVGGSAAPRDGEPVTPRVVNDGLVALSRGTATTRPLVIVKTNPGYSRGCHGACVITGAGRELASGSWAYGDAGRTGSGTDSLVEVVGACGLDVTNRQLVLADERRVQTFTRRGLLSALVADEDPWIRETLEAVVHAEPMIRSVWSDVLAEVEAAEAESVDDAPAAVHHGVSESSLALLGVTLQGSADQGLALAGDVAVAGGETWALVHVTRGGGKRWSAHGLRTEGVTLLRERGDTRLYRVDSPDWRVDYDRHRDGQFSHTVTAPESRALPEAPETASEPATAQVGGGLSHNPFAVLLSR